MDEPDSNPAASDHIMDWLHGSFSSLPADLDDPYEHFHGYQWLEPNLEQFRPPESPLPTPTSAPPPPLPATSATTSADVLQSEPSKKRKQSTVVSMPNNQRRRNQAAEGSAGDRVVDEERQSKKCNGSKRGPSRNGSNPHGGGGGGAGSKETRWAEELLIPCASAFVAGHVYRVQHKLCVLNELASLSGDANHRLAAHGLQALLHHLPLSVTAPVGCSVTPAPTFAAADPKLFHDSLMLFNEKSPWFSFPNSLANASILHALNSDPFKHRSNLHIIDIGVSHGVQWPTLLEALTHRPTGKPGLVRLTVVPPTISEAPVPFSVGPPGDDFLNRLLRFAKNIHLNLQIERHADADALQGRSLREDKDETVVVCAQFRLHQLAHHHKGSDGGEENKEDGRTEFLRRLAEEVEPDLMVLSEFEGECACPRCGDYAAGFSRRVEFLRRFLDTTRAAFKGRECEERRVVEGEAATALGASGEMREGRERWCERMRRAGFAGVVFGEEAIDGGRALLRKHDCNWEMRVEEGGSGPISLCWKGQPILFSSLWKPLRPIKPT